MKRGMMEKILFASIHLHKKNFKLLPKLLWMLNRMVFSTDVPYTADLDARVRFGHNGLGTVINKSAKVGAETLIMQHVCICGSLGKKREIDGIVFTSPIIGKHTFIGVGATLLGPIIVGHNCIIGAGSVVTCDIPDNSVVVGIPGKVIRSSRDDELDKF